MNTRNKTSTIIAAASAIILAAFGLWWVAGREDSSVSTGDAARGSLVEYSHEGTGMSFSHDAGYSSRLMNDQGVDIVVVQSKDDASKGLQISLIPFDEDASSLTFERITAELPDLVVDKPQTGTLPFGSQALSFETGEEAFRTREVWFVREGYLYQMSAPIASSPLIESVIASMRFK